MSFHKNSGEITVLFPKNDPKLIDCFMGLICDISKHV